MPDHDFIIKLQQLSFRYKSNDVDTLNNLSLAIKPGECVGLIGPNGAGKSTLISIITGLLSAQTGSVCYGDNATPRQFIKQQLALVPQEYAFYERLTVQQNLAYFASLLKTNNCDELVTNTLAQCQLSHVSSKKADNLSGGYKRRLNLAIALLKQPSVLILDEPTVGIDPVSRELIMQLLATLKQQGTTIFYTSHLLTEVEQICDTIYGLKRGELIHITAHSENAPLQISFESALCDDAIAGITALLPNTQLNSPSQIEISSCKEPLALLAQLNQVSLPPISEINYSTLHLENYYKELFTEL